MKPTLTGYLELLIKVFTAMIVLIFWGVLIAAIVIAVPFLLSLFCVLALVGAGAFVFSWTYVLAGTILFLVLIAVIL